ncbi:MAG: response regulator [Candidatus Thiodiazotropha taylori]|nr:response regulator [Candidatus Thiodiazotropha taylori]
MHFSILLIEPPGIDSQLLQLMLGPEKFRVRTSECGLKAWNTILTDDVPDLVVMDADLPQQGELQITAVQLLEMMNNQAQWSNIPKIILASNSNPSILKISSVASVNAIILKPYDPRRFIQEIYKSLKQHIESHIAEVNRQHIQLGTAFQELIQLSDQGNFTTLKSAFTQLSCTIEKHFDFEEHFMARHNYPDFIDHHDNHKQLLTIVESMKSEMAQSNKAITSERIVKLRTDLFEDVNDDKKYIKFLSSLRSSLVG